MYPPKQRKYPSARSTHHHHHRPPLFLLLLFPGRHGSLSLNAPRVVCVVAYSSISGISSSTHRTSSLLSFQLPAAGEGVTKLLDQPTNQTTPPCSRPRRRRRTLFGGCGLLLLFLRLRDEGAHAPEVINIIQAISLSLSFGYMCQNQARSVSHIQ